MMRNINTFILAGIILRFLIPNSFAIAEEKKRYIIRGGPSYTLESVTLSAKAVDPTGQTKVLRKLRTRPGIIIESTRQAAEELAKSIGGEVEEDIVVHLIQ